MKYLIVRKQLDDLGYSDKFPMECFPLIEKMTADLLQTTRSLQHYMGVAKEALKERDIMKSAAEPYVCDNAKLIKENTQLHQELVELQEEFNFCKKETKSKIRQLENELSNLEFEHRSLQTRNREKELKNLCADTFSSRSKYVTNFTRTCCSKSNSDETCACDKKPCSRCKELESQVECLTSNLNDSRNRSTKLLDDIAFFKSQVNNRDKENARLIKLLEGGRPFSALQKDCCGKDLDRKLVEVSAELHEAENKAEALNIKLKEALDKQHEAMNRALQLADRNSVLEKELCNIDQLALKIEFECNDQLKEKCSSITNLQNQLQAAKANHWKLEKEFNGVKDRNCILQAELESNKNENAALNMALVSCNDLKEKISKESELSKASKYREAPHKAGISRKTDTGSNSPHSPQKSSQINPTFYNLSENKSSCTCHSNEKTTKTELLLLLENERKLYESQINEIKKQLADVNKVECQFSRNSLECSSCEKFKQERDFYYKRNFASHPSEDYIADLKTKNCELQQKIQVLKNQNESLQESTQLLKSSLDQMKNTQNKTYRNSDLEMESRMQLAINKLERDLKRAHADIQFLEDDRNALRCKLITSATNSVTREERDYNSYAKHSSMVDSILKERDILSEKLKITETELLHLKSLNNQLKTLQLENDKNIADSQAMSYESKRELRDLTEKVRVLEKCKSELEHECHCLKSDKLKLRDSFSKIDQERDKLIIDLDEKTERLSEAEQALRSRDTTIKMLENKMRELNTKVELLTQSNASVEHRVRDSQTRNEALSIELQTISKQRDNALIENKRLQGDLATVNNDLKTMNREYDNSRREVDQMKQQLQHYVDEVRRIEDILSRKEAERTDMLDHFASLSHDATVLENNNHSLESLAASKNVQLQVTMDRLNELEKKLESRESLIDLQESKMSSLIYQISKLECELTQQKDLTDMAEKNLQFARDTCATLEKQKKAILIGVGETDCERKKLEFNLRSLKEDKSKIEETYMRDRATVESLESLLNSSRREVVELKLQLQEAVEETKVLKDKIEQLQFRLKKVEGESHSSRQRSEEAAKNLQELKWQINDQRFHRVRISEQAASSSSKHCTGTF